MISGTCVIAREQMTLAINFALLQLKENENEIDKLLKEVAVLKYVPVK